MSYSKSRMELAVIYFIGHQIKDQMRISIIAGYPIKYNKAGRFQVKIYIKYLPHIYINALRINSMETYYSTVRYLPTYTQCNIYYFTRQLFTLGHLFHLPEQIIYSSLYYS